MERWLASQQQSRYTDNIVISTEQDRLWERARFRQPPAFSDPDHHRRERDTLKRLELASTTSDGDRGLVRLRSHRAGSTGSSAPVRRGLVTLLRGPRPIGPAGLAVCASPGVCRPSVADPEWWVGTSARGALVPVVFSIMMINFPHGVCRFSYLILTELRVFPSCSTNLRHPAPPRRQWLAWFLQIDPQASGISFLEVRSVTVALAVIQVVGQLASEEPCFFGRD